MRSYWIKMGFNPMTDVLINGWKFGQRHTDKRMPCYEKRQTGVMHLQIKEPETRKREERILP